MCANEWSAIEYSKLPSKAMSDLMKAFSKHDKDRFGEYLTSLEKGETKINTGAVYPYDIIKSLNQGNTKGANAQWGSLPNYMENNNEKFLPVVDVSGSMSCPAGGSANLTCMDVCVSLGLYLADKNTGPFKDMFLTFSTKSKIEILKGNLLSKLAQLQRAEWDMSTNLHAAFNTVLDFAVKGNVDAKDMPRYVLIMSDMEFNQCAKHDDSAMEMIARKYEAAGYTVPNIVFWNLNARAGNVPVKHDKKGVALVSGFSPAIMKSILSAESLDPVNVMLATINAPRYAVIA
jgi:hypothetical protein